ncbi:MAG: SpoIIIAH-like protein [Sedimentibacter sp.]|jgi:stage III sporulation protein AH|nr:SpoIIIAH-like protein [Sedimentibacter sp.]
MIMKKETLVFITSLAIIFIIGYVNLTMSPEDTFDADDYAQVVAPGESDTLEEDIAEFVEGEENAAGEEVAEGEDAAVAETEGETPAEAVEGEAVKEDLETAESEDTLEESDYEILGDITDITDLNSAEASSTGILDTLSASFSSFKLNKNKGNMDVIDHLEESISNASISEETKEQFESLLLNKNSYIEAEQSIEIMLQSKGYNETVVIVDSDTVKVVTNETIEQADATKILDVIVSETEYEPSQIKIVKFDNIDL